MARRGGLRLPLEVVARFLLAPGTARQLAVAAVLARDGGVGVPRPWLHPHAKLAVLPEIQDIARLDLGPEIRVCRPEARVSRQLLDAHGAVGASAAIDGYDLYVGPPGWWLRPGGGRRAGLGEDGRGEDGRGAATHGRGLDRKSAHADLTVIDER